MCASYNWNDIKGNRARKKYNPIRGGGRKNATGTSEVNSVSEKISRRTPQKEGKQLRSRDNQRVHSGMGRESGSVIKTNANGRNEGHRRPGRSRNVTGNEAAFRKTQRHRRRKWHFGRCLAAIIKRTGVFYRLQATFTEPRDNTSCIKLCVLKWLQNEQNKQDRIALNKVTMFS